MPISHFAHLDFTIALALRFIEEGFKAGIMDWRATEGLLNELMDAAQTPELRRQAEDLIRYAQRKLAAASATE